ncbi:acyltransferase family protein [Novosphingobium sp. M1R2S20]|uniref:Acyltransferase family protein n=1 Tax=Novosphingobium rhizovicinum TaxID=3228928 RepID=A0ABV3RC27_9SPHN
MRAPSQREEAAMHSAGGKFINPQSSRMHPSDGLPRKLESLQWLRAVAAMSVVYFHAVIQAKHVFFIGMTEIGETGVDIFFVLSGFIMWVTTRNSPISMGQFIGKRIERIVPLYWVLTLAVAACAIIVPHLLRSTKFDIAHLLTSLFFMPWANPAGMPGTSTYISPVIIPGWTLNMEMMFYILFALCLPLRKKWRVFGIAFLISALYVVGNVGGNRGYLVSFYGNSIIFEFLMGVLLAAYLIPFLKLSVPWAWMLLFLSLIILAYIEASSPDFPRALKFGVPAFFAIAAAINLERLSAVPNFPILVKLGDASYSIYLSHIFVISALRTAWNLLDLDRSDWNAFAFVTVSVAVSAIFGLLIHEYVERPLSRFKFITTRSNKNSNDALTQH